MPIRRRRTTTRIVRRRRMTGRGVISDAWNLVKRRVKSVIPSWSTVKNAGLAYARDNKLLSTVARKLTNDSIGDWVHKQTGYGRRRRRVIRRRPLTGGVRRRRTTRRRMTGRGFFGDIWKGIKNVGSTVAPAVGNFAVKRLLGSGRRRRRTYSTRSRLTGGRRLISRVGRPRNTGRRMTGRGLLGSILGNIIPI